MPQVLVSTFNVWACQYCPYTVQGSTIKNVALKNRLHVKVCKCSHVDLQRVRSIPGGKCGSFVRLSLAAGKNVTVAGSFHSPDSTH